MRRSYRLQCRQPPVVTRSAAPQTGWIVQCAFGQIKFNNFQGSTRKMDWSTSNYFVCFLVNSVKNLQLISQSNQINFDIDIIADLLLVTDPVDRDEILWVVKQESRLVGVIDQSEGRPGSLTNQEAVRQWGAWRGRDARMRRWCPTRSPAETPTPTPATRCSVWSLLFILACHVWLVTRWSGPSSLSSRRPGRRTAWTSINLLHYALYQFKTSFP